MTEDKDSNNRSWEWKRAFVYERDGGICDICRTAIEFEYYECGHIVDRVCGGSDNLDNLVCMCNFCNRSIKELHESLEQYEEWKKTDPIHRFNQGLMNHLVKEFGSIEEVLKAWNALEERMKKSD